MPYDAMSPPTGSGDRRAVMPDAPPSPASAAPDGHTAFLLHWFPKPSETFLFDELSLLRRWGVPMSVISLYGRHPGPFPEPAAGDGGIPVHRLGIRALGRIARDAARAAATDPSARRLWGTVPWHRWPDLEMAGENAWAFLCGFHLARLARERGVTHLHACWASGPATAAWVASRLSGIPFSFTAWAGDIFPPDGALPAKIRDSAFVRSTSETFAGHLRAEAGPHAGRVQVVRNGQDPSRFPAARPFDRPGLRLLAMGRFVPKKGFVHALDAAARLAAERVDFRLTLAGAGPGARSLRRRASALGLGDRVRFPGWMPREGSGSCHLDGDIFLLPSVVDAAGDRDGIPNVVMEAMLHGLPVIASDVGAVRELVRHRETGLLVPPGDDAALAAAIRDLAARPDEALAMAARGREWVRRHFDLATNCRRFLDLLATRPEADHG